VVDCAGNLQTFSFSFNLRRIVIRNTDTSLYRKSFCAVVKVKAFSGWLIARFTQTLQYVASFTISCTKSTPAE